MSGATLHDGLEYQALVSALAAVELVIVSGYAVQLLIEPPSDEDLEAGVDRVLGDDEPTPGEGQAPTHTSASEEYTLVVQSKRRDHGTWTAPGVEALLKHGKARVSARARLLADPAVRYLLVTSGMSVHEATSLHVERFGEWPDLAHVDERFKDYDAGDRCRVGVMGGFTEAVLKARLERALRSSLFVPFDRVDACIAALVDAARVRGRSAHSGVWTKGEIGQILKDHDALLPGEIDAGDYVEPQNFERLVETLSGQRAVLILGPSGTGKTRTALRLRDQLREDNPGIRCPSMLTKLGAGQVAAELQRAPVILYIEDPWGPVALEDGAASWTKALQDAAAKRKPNAWLIITSRSDVYQDAKIPADAFANWKVTLEAGDYGPSERRRMIETGLKSLSFRLREAAEPFVDRAIEVLSTPLEIRTFITGLASGPRPGESGPELTTRVLRAAQSKLYKNVITEQINARGDVGAASLLWLLFKGDRVLTLDDVIRVRRAITREKGAAPSLEDLVEFLRAGHSLDQDQDRYSYAHPQVEAGLVEAILGDPATFEAAGKALIESLAAQPAGAAIGPMLAARILAGLAAANPKQASALADVISSQARSTIEAQILAAVKSLDGKPFVQAFEVAARVGSPGVLHFDLAKWLLDAAPISADAELHDMIPRWLDADPDPSWQDQIAADPSAQKLLEKAVEHLAGREQEFYPDDFGARLEVLGVDLAPAFGRAALEVTGHGFDQSVARLVAGALPTLSTLEPAVRAAQKMYGVRETPDRLGWRLQLVNGVFDDDYADHLSSGDDDGWSAGEITSAWVKAKREREGYAALAAFPDAHLLAWDWADAIEKDSAAVDPAEIRAFAQVVQGQDREHVLWNLVARSPVLGVEDLIAARLSANAPTGETRSALRRAQAVQDFSSLLAEQDRKLAAGDVDGALLLLRDLISPRFSGDNPALVEAQAQLIAALPANLTDLALAAVADMSQVHADQAGDAGRAARQVSSRDPDLAARLLKLTGGDHPDFENLYAAAMDGWTPAEPDNAQAALDIAFELDRDDLIAAALYHPLASIARRAIRHLGSGMTEAALMALPGKDGHFVREAIVEAIGAHTGDAAAAILLDFCGDTYNRAYGHPPQHAVARKAATLLAGRPDLPPAVLETIKARAADYQDVDVRRRLLARLGKAGASHRAWLLAAATSNDNPLGLRLHAALALLSNAQACLSDGLPLPGAEFLLDAPGAVAAVTTRLASAIATEAEAIALATRLASSPDRHGLMLLLARADRPVLNKHIAGLLAPGHAAVALTTFGGPPVPAAALDDLAEPAVVRAMKSLLKARLEPPPTALSGPVAGR